MAALKNLKRETFCRKILEGTKHGISQAEAYERSGYRTSGHASEVAASRLLSSVEVQRRIAELQAPAIRRTQTTVDDLAAQLDAVFAGASGDKQWGAAGSAAGLKAKLLGFLRERIEVGGPGSMDAEPSLDDLIQRVGDGDPAAALENFEEFVLNIRSELESRCAARAKAVSAPTAEDEEYPPTMIDTQALVLALPVSTRRRPRR
jgi:hypothetical protein